MAKNKRAIPKEKQIYKHFKGSLYEIVTIAVHTETSDKLVVYRSLEKPERVFARPLDMFLSEVDHIRYPLVKAKYRFTLLVEETVEEAEETTDEGFNTEEAEETTKEEIETENSYESDGDMPDNDLTDDNAIYKEDGELVLDPIVERVLDEKEFTDKIAYFERLRGKCTDEMLTTIAISLDIQLENGTTEEKYAQIFKTLRMHEKYESARLRF